MLVERGWRTRVMKTSARLTLLAPVPRAPGIDLFQALIDVAEALGYQSRERYNNACEHRPAEVEARLKAL